MALIILEHFISPNYISAPNFFSRCVKEKTGSGKGSAILKEWEKYLPLFWQLVPPSEEDTPEASAEYERTTAGKVTLQSA